MTTPGKQAHPAVFQAPYEAVAIVLDLVQPAGTRRRNARDGRDARLNEAGRQVTWKEIHSTVIKDHRGEPMDDGNGEVEESAGDVAIDASRQSIMSLMQSSTIISKPSRSSLIRCP